MKTKALKTVFTEYIPSDLSRRRSTSRWSTRPRSTSAPADAERRSSPRSGPRLGAHLRRHREPAAVRRQRPTALPVALLHRGRPGSTGCPDLGRRDQCRNHPRPRSPHPTDRRPHPIDADAVVATPVEPRLATRRLDQRQEQPMNMTPVISRQRPSRWLRLQHSRPSRVQFRSGGTYDYYAVPGAPLRGHAPPTPLAPRRTTDPRPPLQPSCADICHRRSEAGTSRQRRRHATVHVHPRSTGPRSPADVGALR